MFGIQKEKHKGESWHQPFTRHAGHIDEEGRVSNLILFLQAKRMHQHQERNYGPLLSHKRKLKVLIGTSNDEHILGEHIPLLLAAHTSRLSRSSSIQQPSFPVDPQIHGRLCWRPDSFYRQHRCL